MLANKKVKINKIYEVPQHRTEELNLRDSAHPLYRFNNNFK